MENRSGLSGVMTTIRPINRCEKHFIDGDLIAEGTETRVCAKKADDGEIRATSIPEEIKKRLSVS